MKFLNILLGLFLILIVITIFTLIKESAGWTSGGGILVMLPLIWFIQFIWKSLVNPKNENKEIHENFDQKNELKYSDFNTDENSNQIADLFEKKELKIELPVEEAIINENFVSHKKDTSNIEITTSNYLEQQTIDDDKIKILENISNNKELIGQIINDRNTLSKHIEHIRKFGFEISAEELLEAAGIISKVRNRKIETQNNKDCDQEVVIYREMYSNGEKYEGNFLNGKMHGKGTFYYKSGDTYSGEWKFGQKNGNGTYFFKNGDKYEGEFIDNRKYGCGILYYANGTRFEGFYINENRNGVGSEYNSKNEKLFEGEYKDDLRNGDGKIFFQNGTYYISKYVSGRNQGTIAYYNSSGEKINYLMFQLYKLIGSIKNIYVKNKNKNQVIKVKNILMKFKSFFKGILVPRIITKLALISFIGLFFLHMIYLTSAKYSTGYEDGSQTIDNVSKSVYESILYSLEPEQKIEFIENTRVKHAFNMTEDSPIKIYIGYFVSIILIILTIKVKFKENNSG